MLTPDKEFALGILDALDDRSVSRFSPFGYGRAWGRDRAWVEQECGIIDGIYAWLERQKRQARHDVPLLQVVTTLCDRLAVARDGLLQDMADMDAVAERAWSTSQEVGIELQLSLHLGLERAGNDQQGARVENRSGTCHL